MRDSFRRLGLPEDADLRQIRRAYRELARRCRSARGDAAAAATPLHGGRESAFADEVDIDFPSVAALVDRMRASFLGPAAETPVTEVRLTPRQASLGVKVPLDVSLSHTCPVCGGRGEVWLDACGACGGTGAGLLPHQLQLAVPPGVRDGTCLRFDVAPPYAQAMRVQVRISIQ